MHQQVAELALKKRLKVFENRPLKLWRMSKFNLFAIQGVGRPCVSLLGYTVDPC